MYHWIHRSLKIIVVWGTTASAIYGQETWNPPLLFELTDESMVTFTWDAAPDIVLQRSFSLEDDSWDTLGASLGLGEQTEPQSDAAAFYRLARLSATSVLEDRLTNLTLNQLRRAIDPTALSREAGETPPSALESNTPHSLSPDTGAVLPYTWATQPGLIRIYNANPGGFTRAYKLYSSANSVLSSTSELRDEIERTTNWQNQPHRFVDLNARNTDGTFPILDPRAQVEGFETPDTESLPMPVEWFYVLEDGSLGTLNDQDEWQGDGNLSETNPITARLAYWADDETCKLNVNVASEGIPWDMPRCDTPQERSYALDQPLRGEVQRHPGHPAQTSLSSLLYPSKSANHPDEANRLTEEELATIYNLTPRVVPRPANWKDILPFDDEPLYDDISSWQKKAREARFTEAAQLLGFITTNNASPETSIHGRPRMSLWPINEFTSPTFRSAYDNQVEQITTIHSRSIQSNYVLQRRDSSSMQVEFYARAKRANVDLFRYIADQTYLPVAGYGGSLAQKYGARLEEGDYKNDTDYDKDHYSIALSMFDRIRGTNTVDPNVASPYADQNPNFFGQVSPMSLMGRDLHSSNGFTERSQNWHTSSLEPASPGRFMTVSELVIVCATTAEATMVAFNNGNPEFEFASGSTSADQRVLERILRNEHPKYEEWLGGPFGPDDEGKTFQAIEIGLIPEATSVTQGYPRFQPFQTLRLFDSGTGYRGALHETSPIRVNGVPLVLWGESIESRSLQQGAGPAIFAIRAGENPRRRPTPDWNGIGGSSTPRLFRFGRFELHDEQDGYYGRQFLPNGSGPLAHWSPQTLVVIEKGQPLQWTQEAPIQVINYDWGAEGASTGNLAQLLNFRFVAPGEILETTAPELGELAYGGWTRRFSRLMTNSPSKASLLAPAKTDAAIGLSVSHGDHRHVAMKRNVPSELFTIHPLATSRRSAHSLQNPGRNGAYAEPGATYGPDIHGRSIVAGVDYAADILPDFTANPLDGETYAPLLGKNYNFPIDPTITRDFDNGLGNLTDGAYINKADESEDVVPGHTEENPLTPYFDFGDHFKYEGVAPAYHIPHRMAPSPVAFGSIPSAAQANAPWTCLLFRPNVSDLPHLGETGNGMRFEENLQTLENFQVPQMASVTGDETLPPDHLWLDYFWMPAAEPSHVATPFATQGKVNLNYQMFPFTNIKRATALHAVLKAEELLAIPTTAGETYKSQQDNPNWRHRIDATETLKQFEAKFARGEAFITESEICEQFLVPEGEQWDGDGTTIRAFWDAHRLSGDNTLERPYAGLYGRVTTRSNVFRLHFRIQEITKGPNSAPERFDAEQDAIVSDRQGSKILERVLDHQHPDLPDYPNTESPRRIEQFYGYRITDID